MHYQVGAALPGGRAVSALELLGFSSVVEFDEVVPRAGSSDEASALLLVLSEGVGSRCCLLHLRPSAVVSGVTVLSAGSRHQAE